MAVTLHGNTRKISVSSCFQNRFPLRPPGIVVWSGRCRPPLRSPPPLAHCARRVPCRIKAGERETTVAGNTFGEWFRVATYGESHGAAVGCVVDGCPARVPLAVEDVQAQLDRRRPGQSRLSTPRDEADRAVILSGVESGVTLGTPIAISVENKNARSGDYELLKAVPRPGHADWTWQVKHGVRAVAGGGRASAR